MLVVLNIGRCGADIAFVLRPFPPHSGPVLRGNEAAALAVVEMELAAQIFGLAKERRSVAAADAASGPGAAALEQTKHRRPDGDPAEDLPDQDPTPTNPPKDPNSRRASSGAKNWASMVNRSLAKELWKGAKLKLHAVLLVAHAEALGGAGPAIADVRSAGQLDAPDIPGHVGTTGLSAAEAAEFHESMDAAMADRETVQHALEALSTDPLHDLVVPRVPSERLAGDEDAALAEVLSDGDYGQDWATELMTGCMDGSDTSLVADLETEFAGDAIRTGDEIADIEDELRDISREAGLRIRAAQRIAGTADLVAFRAPPEMVWLEDADVPTLTGSKE